MKGFRLWEPNNPLAKYNPETEERVRGQLRVAEARIAELEAELKQVHESHTVILRNPQAVYAHLVVAGDFHEARIKELKAQQEAAEAEAAALKELVQQARPTIALAKGELKWEVNRQALGDWLVRAKEALNEEA